MFNEDMEVTTSSNRHNAISILSNFDNTEQVLIFEEDESDEIKIQKIKLNKQFGCKVV